MNGLVDLFALELPGKLRRQASHALGIIRIARPEGDGQSRVIRYGGPNSADPPHASARRPSR